MQKQEKLNNSCKKLDEKVKIVPILSLLAKLLAEL